MFLFYFLILWPGRHSTVEQNTWRYHVGTNYGVSGLLMHLKHVAVVVAQFVERSLLTPLIHGLNPNIGKVLSTNCNYIKKMKIKKKSPGMAHLKKIHL